MRHLKLKNRLGIGTSHRKAMLRNLVTSLFEHGRIKTTLARAKAMRGEVDRIITLARKQNLHSRRLIHSYITSKSLVYDIFNDQVKSFESRNGGYTRIYKIANRQGDNAKMAYIELIKDDIQDLKSSTNETKLLDEVNQEMEDKGGNVAKPESLKSEPTEGIITAKSEMQIDELQEEVVTPETSDSKTLEIAESQESIAGSDSKEEIKS